MYGLFFKCEVKMAGYWPRSFYASLWTRPRMDNRELEQIITATAS